MNFADHFPPTADMYLDSAATTRMPCEVIESMSQFAREEYGPVHRAVYDRAVGATQKYEEARKQIAQWFRLPPGQFILTHGATDALNSVIQSLAEQLQPGDQVLLSPLEHHSMIVPWQRVSLSRGVEIVWPPLGKDGSVDWWSEALWQGQVRVVCCSHLSHITGDQVNLNRLQSLVTERGALLLVDASQSVAHQFFDGSSVDLFVCSAHKMYGPTGVGGLGGKRSVLESLQPPKGGGGAVKFVSQQTTDWEELPLRWEAGTPPVLQVIGWGAAVRWLSRIEWSSIQTHERRLGERLHEGILAMPHVRKLGVQKGPICSFSVEHMHALDVALLCNAHKISVRSGHLCCIPGLQALGQDHLVRASAGIYTNMDEIETLLDCLHRWRESCLDIG